ncbi:hypothetical protein, partial [Listeria seeligeri]|uniref:hypothetical protein n=1 Tax=Listeria seeligeri TaxID=1640 RepID=UPI0022EC0B52
VKKVTDSLAQEAKKKLTQDLDDIGTAAKTIQAKAKEAFQMPPSLVWETIYPGKQLLEQSAPPRGNSGI